MPDDRLILEQDLGHTGLLSAAKSLAQQISEKILWAKDGSPTWLGPRAPWRGPQVPAGEPPSMVQIGPHLYSGILGIAIFFAALMRAGEGVVYGEQSLLTIASLRRLLRQILGDPKRSERIRMGVGGLTGLGSFIYSFVTLGRLLDAPQLIHEAHELSALLVPSRIAEDQVLDITTGSAGTILALLALDREIPSPNRNGLTPLKIATLCAEHLLVTSLCMAKAGSGRLSQIFLR